MKRKPASQRRPLLEWSVEVAVQPGQAECGDAPLVKPLGHRALVAVVDGSGHGAEAAAVAGLAVATLRNHAEEDLAALMRRCHQQLSGTRGAVMSLACFDADKNTMRWLGVGNVEGVLLRARGGSGPRREMILLRPGVVGYRLPAVEAAVVPVAAGDVLILATDGIRGGFADRVAASESPQHIASEIRSRYAKSTDDGLVLVARYLGCPADTTELSEQDKEAEAHQSGALSVSAASEAQEDAARRCRES